MIADKMEADYSKTRFVKDRLFYGFRFEVSMSVFNDTAETLRAGHWDIRRVTQRALDRRVYDRI